MSELESPRTWLAALLPLAPLLLPFGFLIVAAIYWVILLVAFVTDNAAAVAWLLGA